jgi:hypothetical protein
VMGIHPVVSMLKGLWLTLRYHGADVLSPVAAELVLRRAALKDRKYVRVCPNVLYR